MRDNRQRSDSADRIARRTRRGQRRLITTYRRSGGLAVLVAAAAVALAVFSQTGSSHAASLGKRTGSGNRAGISRAHRSGRSAATTSTTDKSTGLLDEWATCERSHGDPHQTDPTVEHRVIYIAVQMGALQNWDPNDATALCGEELAAARRAVAGGPSATHLGADGSLAPGWGDNAKYVQYANCMRGNGYPTFPTPREGSSRTGMGAPISTAPASTRTAQHS